MSLPVAISRYIQEKPEQNKLKTINIMMLKKMVPLLFIGS